jgi:hypothetical protein
MSIAGAHHRGLVRLVAGGLLLLSAHAWATPPVLYSQPAYESPVRGDPDDLLLLSGSGLSGADTVVYAAVGNTTSLPPTPLSVPVQNSATQGALAVVNASDAPYALAVHLSTAMMLGQSYALWVVSPDHEWSAPVLINDARPLWITPDSSFQTASLANLPRTLKVVGRNLQPAQGSATATQVRLVGQTTGTTYVLVANNSTNDPNTTAALERYVAAVNLPSPMTVDTYNVQVSRDGRSWVALLGNGQSPAAQTFTVNSDPTALMAAQTFSVGDFSDPLSGQPCVANDGVDDTGCIILAIRAAQAAGGGTVTFGPGTWLMSNAGSWAGQGYSNRTGYQPGYCPGDSQTCGVSYSGVIVPVGVNLRGAGATGSSPTVVERGLGWPTTMAVFTLQGNNAVSGFDFTDDNNYLNNYANQTSGGAELQLGVEWYFATMYAKSDPRTVSNVTISNNVFDKPYVAITNGGLPVDHVYITYNTLGGAFSTAIQTGEDENNVENLLPGATLAYQPYTWRDSVTAYNTFYPSSFQVTPAVYNSGAPGGNGSIATQVNTGLRVDMSNNVADGTATRYLYTPATDPRGWRAAFFWSTGASQEMTLVSNNTVSCSGDKYGDGEAIVYDSSSALGGMPAAESVVSTVPWTDESHGVAGSSLTAQGIIVTQLPSSKGAVDISADPTLYYQGYWLQVVQGMGKGQWRKVASVSLGSNVAGATVTFNVTPAFDVPPDPSSEVVLGRAHWQNATVNNTVEQRMPPCMKSNTRDSGGAVSWYASTADSAMEGNQQYGTSGILLNHTYQPPQSSSTTVTPAGIVLQSYNEVRNNLVSGAYDWSSAGRAGGIQLGFGATAYYCSGNTCPAPSPVPTGFGVCVAGNTISQASARDAGGSVHPPIGGIGLDPEWSTGPIDPLGLAMWELDDDTLIFHNTLQNISNTVSGSAGGAPLVGIGVDLAQGSTLTPAVNWRPTLYANSCSNVDVPVGDFGLSTTRYCPGSQSGSCECSGLAMADVGVTVSAIPASGLSAGGTATFTVTVTNNDPATMASDVTLSVTPSAGVTINGASYSSSQGTCDPSINICMLGSLAATQSTTVTVTGTFSSSGTWPVTFSVTHHEYDGNPANDTASITETLP